MSKADKTAMEALHGLLARHFASELANPSGEGVSPAMLNTIRQFLKDNGIGVELKGDEDALQKLREKAPFRLDETLADVEREIQH